MSAWTGGSCWVLWPLQNFNLLLILPTHICTEPVFVSKNISKKSVQWKAMGRCATKATIVSRAKNELSPNKFPTFPNQWNISVLVKIAGKINKERRGPSVFVKISHPAFSSSVEQGILSWVVDESNHGLSSCDNDNYVPQIVFSKTSTTCSQKKPFTSFQKSV